MYAYRSNRSSDSCVGDSGAETAELLLQDFDALRSLFQRELEARSSASADVRFSLRRARRAAAKGAALSNQLLNRLER
jgi:hypothetical protein